ncbi:MAG: hypothetical protein M1819_003187 [Sarea resinae]|nr:MAG: hypothetical protein M1819_003187 [Sarea resinae]
MFDSNKSSSNGASAPKDTVLTSASAQKPWSVQSILSTLPSQPETNTTSPVPFFHLLERLKTTKREGWRRFSISTGESISDHMYRMSILTMFAPASLAARINVQHCTRMALIHDMAEALVGDITPVDGIAKAEKSRREAETMDYICTSLLGKVGGGITGKEIRAIWQEYEDSETLDAKYVHDIDKVELVLQMVEYERAHGGGLNLEEFSRVAKRVELPEVQAWCVEILKEREAFWKGVSNGKSADIPSDALKAQQDQYYGNGTA